MKRLSKEKAALFAAQIRALAGLNDREPIHIKSLLVKLGILTRYRPLSEKSYGLSLQTPDKSARFMLINSNTTRGRQHFTAAHELYHLFFDPNPIQHISSKDEEKSPAERDADLFASVFLMPQSGIVSEIPVNEMRTGLSVATLLRLEQLFSVSNEAMIYRLRALHIIDEREADYFKGFVITDIAKENGYDLSLYKRGNENVTLGDFGSNARKLYEQGKISEGHYMELLNQIS